MKPLTKRQKQLFDFIDSYIQANGISPTINEMRKKFKLNSVSTVHQHIDALILKGYLKKDSKAVRGIRIDNESPSIKLPIIGLIAAGKPLEAHEATEDYIEVSRNLIKNDQNHYALRVLGDSMIEEGIFDGDIVVIKKQSVAENGQTVVAVIDNNEATLKKIYREKNGFRLEPANQALLPIYRNEVEVRGVVIQVIRNIDNQPEEEKLKKNGYKTIDLFAGVGGIRLGFENAGFETVFSNDFELRCKLTYDLNFNTAKLVVEDIRKLDINDLPNFDSFLEAFPARHSQSQAIVRDLKMKKVGATYSLI